MTLTTWLLLPLLIAAAAGCVAHLLPSAPPLEPHPYETDPLEDVGDHVGRHERDDGPTRRLLSSRLRR